jgi:hypothetical protein
VKGLVVQATRCDIVELDNDFHNKRPQDCPEAISMLVLSVEAEVGARAPLYQWWTDRWVSPG